jgi:rubrerythrin
METHEVYFGRLIDTKAGSHANPMTYAYYHRVRRGKAPKNAPTYRGDAVEAPSNEVYVCSVCGYEYHGDITKEPETYVCPQCGFPKSAFVKKS